VPQRPRRTARQTKTAHLGSTAKRIFGPLADAGAEAYSRSRDLPKLIALWPHELDDLSRQGRLRVLAKLRIALRTERRRARSAHWSYDLNRHLGLLSAYKAELAGLRARFRRIAPDGEAASIADETACSG
jgi:hypothetical protein